jgi:hypothetical protein
MIYLAQYSHGSLAHAGDKVTLPKLGARLTGMFRSPFDPTRAGLYIVSANAGFQSSLTFWIEAQRNGIAFASPELFPWTLANAAGGWLARHFGITGPNATYTGQVEALLAAFEQAAEHLTTEDQIDTAWIVAIDFAQTASQRTHFGILRLSLRPSEIGMEPTQNAKTSGRSPRATTALLKVFAALQKGDSMILSDGAAAWRIQPLQTTRASHQSAR